MKGYQKWIDDAETVTFRSAGAPFECHYYCNMRTNKEIFCALVQVRAENITYDYRVLAHKLKELTLLRRKPSSVRLQNFIDYQNFQILYQNILEQTGTEPKMTNRYLKDVSSLLPLVSAFREKNLKRYI